MTIFFQFTNILTIFQFLINNILQSYVNKFTIVYFNDIIIYSKTKKKYLEYIKKVLKALSDQLTIHKTIEIYYGYQGFTVL